jgi:hypothetical protein
MKFGNYCLEEAFNDPDQLVLRFQHAIDGSDARDGLRWDSFDGLVGTGFSGALVVPTLARATGKDFLILRKPGDQHHHGTAIAEGTLPDSGKWLFVDDGIGTGKTYTRARYGVNRLALTAGIPDKFAGAYLYGHDNLHPAQAVTPDHWLLRVGNLDRDAQRQLDGYTGDRELSY